MLDIYDLNGISLTSILKEDLDLSSLDRMELVMVCEKEFDIEIKDEEISGIVTVGDIVNLIFKQP
jgi:acyl carrier protein